jgi:YHS domain-containing protein
MLVTIVAYYHTSSSSSRMALFYVYAFAPSGFLLYDTERTRCAGPVPGPRLRGMRTDDSGPRITHDGETYYFCSDQCMRSFEQRPAEFARHHPQVSGTEASQSHEHH